MQSFLKKYSVQLNNFDYHLSYEVLARYINNYKNLSEKEINFIETHLAKCNECSKKFFDVFDEEFEITSLLGESDENHLNIKFHQLKNISNENGIVHFYNEEMKIHLTLSKDNDENITINFNEVPKKFSGQKIKCSVSENDINIETNLLIRIVSLEENKKYSFKTNKVLDVDSIQEINAEILLKSEIKNLNHNIFEWKRYIPYSIAASILIMLGVIFYFLSRNENINELQLSEQIIIDSSKEKTEAESAEKSAPQKTEQKIVEENEISINNDFATNDILENFIERNVRGNEIVRVIAPKISDTLNLPILFKWENKKDVNNFNLIIVNNSNETVWNINTIDNEIEFNEKLKSGLYYWKLEADNELQYVGKFFVK